MIVSPEERRLYEAFARAVRAKAARDVEAEQAHAGALRASVVPAVAAAVEEARRGGLCGCAWLFGSFAWGRPGSSSDVDLLVEEANDPDLVAGVVGAATGRAVHVVRRERAPESLVRRAITEGLPL